MNHPTHPEDGIELVQIGPLPTAPRGPRQWRSLEELAGTPEFAEALLDEFPAAASEWADPGSRREFLRLMGASMALAGVGGCAYQPLETIVPYVKAPEEIVPGRPLFFATAAPFGGFGVGALAESHEGRPTKLEGNRDHPASLGGTDIFLQAEILGLYDPDRSQVVLHNGRVSTWDDFVGIVIPAREKWLAKKGAGLRFLTETFTSPTLGQQFQRFFEQFPEAKWHRFDAVGRENSREGTRRAFGEAVEPVYHFDKADVVLSLDADFLSWGPGRIKDALAYVGRRETVGKDGPARNRLYVVEPTPSVTGSVADERLPLQSRLVADLAQAVARGLGVEGIAAPATALPTKAAAWVAAVVDDLKAHRGAGLVLAGEPQPPEVHVLAHAINQALGNVGKTVEFLPSLEAGPTAGAGGLRDLVDAMSRGEVESLVIVGGNPVYAAPGDVNFAEWLDKIAFTVHLSQHEDETSVHCHWHIPEAHFLETWGDIRAFDGTVTIQQPLIAPLYGGKSACEFVEVLLAGLSRPGLEILRDYWKGTKPEGDFETFWRTSLHAGVVAGTAAKPKDVSLKSVAGTQASGGASAGIETLEIVIRPDPTIWDGRYANNGWLQELPKTLTRLTWENAALVSPATAKRLRLSSDAFEAKADIVQLNYRGQSIRLPVWILPGHADDSVTVYLGYGRTRAGRVGTSLGANAYAMRTTDAPWSGSGLEIRKMDETTRTANTQHQWNMVGRRIARGGTLAEFLKDPHFAQEHDEHPPKEMTLYQPPEPQRVRQEDGVENSWGMAINLNACIGCGACVVACQAENNIPVVGKDQVIAGRAMHWIRVDRYFEGDPENPQIYNQPVPCMHCEEAPCELVCPVAATSHSAEGLNEMTYNRCVGTRYCGNNCPYKVRRFNFFQYADQTTPSLKLLNNPDVTVRTRGVMEKCTYCVQRLTQARIAVEQQGRTQVLDGEVQTACQGACPTRAIVFGNLNDPNSEVVKAKASPRNYALLAELNTRPRTTYLAKLTNPSLSEPTNPHPDVEGEVIR